MSVTGAYSAGRVSRGNHAGKSDAVVGMAVRSCLHQNLSLPLDSVSVRVFRGWVTLGGNLSWDFQKEAAEDCLRDVPGVRGVTNELRFFGEIPHIQLFPNSPPVSLSRLRREVMSVMPPHPELLRLTGDITAAHVSHNEVSEEDLPALIRAVYDTLSGACIEAHAENTVQTAKRPSAVPVKRSVFPDHIVCLEDGDKLKVLKRHLRACHGLTPETYRQRWALSSDYPMVAPNYAAVRSTLAKGAGLGRQWAAPAGASASAIQRIPEGVIGTRASRKMEPV